MLWGFHRKCLGADRDVERAPVEGSEVEAKLSEKRSLHLDGAARVMPGFLRGYPVAAHHHAMNGQPFRAHGLTVT